jgi:hypothetical protein
MMDWLSYAFNFVPWWVWIVGLLVASIVTYQFWAPIWAVTPRPAKVTLAAVGAVLAAYVAGRNRGSKDERAKAAEASTKAIQRREDIHNDVQKLPDSDVVDRLGKPGWLRDGD